MRPRRHGNRSVEENSIVGGSGKEGATTTSGTGGIGAARGHGTAGSGHGTVGRNEVDKESLTSCIDSGTGAICGSCLRGGGILAKGFGTP